MTIAEARLLRFRSHLVPRARLVERCWAAADVRRRRPPWCCRWPGPRRLSSCCHRDDGHHVRCTPTGSLANHRGAIGDGRTVLLDWESPEGALLRELAWLSIATLARSPQTKDSTIERTQRTRRPGQSTRRRGGICQPRAGVCSAARCGSYCYYCLGGYDDGFALVGSKRAFDCGGGGRPTSAPKTPELCALRSRGTNLDASL